jgi:hypothetical protein
MSVLIAASALALLGAGRQDRATGASSFHEQLACAPMSLAAPPVAGIRIVGGYQPGRMMFGPGDPLVIDAGSSQGIRPGQVYFVRRHVRDEFTPSSIDFRPISIHTTGWVTVVDVRETMSIAQVTHACDGMGIGDYLEPYVDPVEPPLALQGDPDYEHAGRIVMGDDRHQTGSEGSLMLVNRGGDHEVRPGQTVTIFRETLGGGGPVFTVGRATVLSVRPETSLIRIDSSREAVYIGDRIAINRITK